VNALPVQKPHTPGRPATLLAHPAPEIGILPGIPPQRRSLRQELLTSDHRSTPAQMMDAVGWDTIATFIESTPIAKLRALLRPRT
jgi:hypothetical protein